MSNPGYLLHACFCFSLAASGCGGGRDAHDDSSSSSIDDASGIISFELDRIGDDGLIGPPDGRRSVMYEFCVPADSARTAEVRAIDPSLELYPASRGRAECSDAQILCVGSTHQPGWRAILERLAALDYVTRIDEVVWE
ncbi:MAG: hypothetical protein P8049_11625 [Gemmatimonadota bacterium]|jgi:hypothetical protein